MGAPDSACGRMEPGHGFSPQEASSVPALLTVESNEVAPGNGIKVRLEGKDGAQFKGFLIQARDASRVDEKDSQVGSFETEEASYMTCGRGIHNAITHRNSDLKAAVEAVWNAPEDFEGEIIFR